MGKVTTLICGWREFLQDVPLGVRATVDDAATRAARDIYAINVSTPNLQLFCNDDCKAVTYFSISNQVSTGKLFAGFEINHAASPRLPADVLFMYLCEKCRKCEKSYIVRLWKMDVVQKLAEWPPFAPRTPGTVASILGPELELYQKGRRAEIDGLGIAAFAYYRRVVENQKNRLLDEIIRVARHLNANEEQIATLEKAKTEKQFSTAVDRVKDAIPEALLIKTHNPLTLLHDALSRGLHNESDEECLAAAHAIRTFLCELVRKMSLALEEQRELDAALSRLLSGKND